MLWVPVLAASLALASGSTIEEAATNKSVNLLKASINWQIEPCEDFYQFVCSKLVETTAEKNGTNLAELGILRVQPYADGRQSFQNKIVNLLAGNGSSSLNLARLRQFWQSCHNYDPSKKQIESALNITAIKLSRGLLPIKSRSSIDSLASLTAQAIGMQKTGLDPSVFFRFASLLTSKGSKLLILGQPDLEATEFGLAELRNVSKYLKEFEVDLSRMAKLSERLASFLRPDFSPIESVRMSLAQLQIAAPNTNWRDYLSAAINLNTLLDTKQSVIVVTNLDYIRQVDRVLSKESPKTLVDYAAAVKLIQTYREVRKRSPMVCLNDTMRYMKTAVNAAYLEEFISQDELASTVEMAKEIQQAYLEILDNSTWPSETLRQRAKSKIQFSRLNLGNIAELLIDPNGMQLSKLYKWIDYKQVSYPESIIMIRDSFEEVSELQPNDRAFSDMIGSLGDSSNMGTAFYHRSANSINILPYMLHERFTSLGRRQCLNFGLLGATIGHELTHSIDPTGIDQDATGFRNNLTKTDREIYNNRTECMITMFNNHKINIGKGLEYVSDGKLTLKENVADNGGFLTAYYGYQRWVKKHGREARLPGIHLTPRQLFWVSLASKYCSANKYDEKLLEKLKKDKHSHVKLRVNLQLANLREFRRDFKCPPKAKMVIEPNCQFL